MSESNAYKTLRDNVKQPRDRLERVENLMVDGMPDVNFCFNGVEGWVEQKSPKEPVRESTPLFGSNHKFSVDQMNWFLSQINSGGVAYGLISTDKRWLLIGAQCIADGTIHKMTVTELISIALWHEPKPVRGKDKWKQLRRTMILGK